MPLTRMTRRWTCLAFAMLGWVAFERAASSQSSATARLLELARTNDAARTAYAAGDHAGFLKAATRAAELAVGNEFQLLARARGEALTGDRSKALATLQGILDLGSVPDLAHRDLTSLGSDPALVALRERADRVQRERRGSSVELVRFRDRDLITEGVAVDTVSGDLFVSAAFRRSIWRARPRSRERLDGEYAVDEFIGGKRLWGTAGIAVDSTRRRLWICSSARPQMLGAAPDEARRAELVAVDLETGTDVARYSIADSKPGHSCDSVAAAPDGAVYVSDPVDGVVWRLRPAAGQLEPLIAKGLLPSPQGLAVSADGTALYVADYTRGVFRVALKDGELDWLSAPNGVSTAGIDGLAWDGSAAPPRLIAIHNGIQPHRISTLQLDRAGGQIVSGATVAVNLGGWDEPTLGVVYRNTLLYIGRSQWRFLDRTGRLRTDGLQEPAVFALPLASPK